MDRKYNEQVVEHVEIPGACVEIIECNNLSGAGSPYIPHTLHYCEEFGVKFRYIKITTQGVPVMTDTDALYYRMGKFDVGLNSNVVRNAVTGAFTDETLVKPVYKGKGVLALEPSLKYYWIIKLNNSSIVINKSLYYASVGDVKLELISQKNLSTAMFSKAGLFQTKVSGTGIVALELFIPKTELKQIQITPDEDLCVDGNFVIAREPSVNLSVTTNTRGVMSSGASGEGLLNKYSGNGLVWMAPTLPIYRRFINGTVMSNKSSNN